MTTNKNIDLIKDITLLYELSLSVGHSFNLDENIHSFMKILMERKNIDIACVWLLSDFFEESPQKGTYKLVYSNPIMRETVREMKQTDPIPSRLKDRNSYSVSYQSSDFSALVTEKDVFKGVYTIFRLKDIGFVKLYQYARKYPWEKVEQNQLVKVINQFTYSIRTCIDHDLTVREIDKRRKAEQQLKHREREFLDVVDTIDDVFFVFDPTENKFVFISPGFEAIFGIDHEEVFSDPSLMDNYIINDDQMPVSFIDDILKSTRADHEVDIITPQNDRVSLWAKHQMVYDNLGNLVRVVGTIRDITEKRRIQSDLEYRLKFEELLLEISNSFINLNLQDTDNGINSALAHIGEFTQADRSYIFLFHNRGQFMSNTHEWCAKGINPEIENLKNLPADTVPWWMEKLRKFESINIQRVSDLPEEASAEKEILQSQSIKSLVVIPMVLRNRLRGFIGFDFVRKEVNLNRDLIKLLHFVGQIIINAIDRKAQDEKIAAHEIRYKNIVESARDLIYRLDQEQRFIYMNEKALVVLGSSEEEFFHLDLKKIVHPDYVDNVVEFYREQMRKNIENTYLEFPIINRNGEKIWLGQNTSLVTTQHGEKTLEAIARDITDVINNKELLKKAYEQSEKDNRSKTRFVVNTSHEIRTPVHAISGLVGMLSKTSLTKEQSDILTKLTNTSQSMNNFVDNVIDFKKTDIETMELSLETFHPRQSIESVFEMIRFMAEANKVVLKKEIDENIPQVLTGDEGKLQRILINLLENAIKYNSNGYAGVYLATGMKNDGKQFYDFTIEDDGIGISDDIIKELEQAVNYRNTRRFNGAGLGLLISGELINFMGGNLKIEKPLAGTKIQFSIPLELSEEKEQKAQMQQDNKTFPGLRILIVEDNKINRLVASKALDSLEIKHDLATNGKEALEYLKENTYDVVMMDLMMPEMDGFEATRQIRNTLKLKLPVIACTAKKVKGVERECYDAGMNDFLAKPFNENDIREKLNKIVK